MEGVVDGDLGDELAALEVGAVDGVLGRKFFQIVGDF